MRLSPRILVVLLSLLLGCGVRKPADLTAASGTNASTYSPTESVTELPATHFTAAMAGVVPDARRPQGTVIVGGIGSRPMAIEWDIARHKEVRRVEMDWLPPTGADFVTVGGTAGLWGVVVGHKDNVAHPGAVQVWVYDGNWILRRQISVCRQGFVDGMDSEGGLMVVAYRDNEIGDGRRAKVFDLASGEAVGERAWISDNEQIGYPTSAFVRAGKIYLGYFRDDEFVLEERDRSLRTVLHSRILFRGNRVSTYGLDVLRRSGPALLACFPMPGIAGSEEPLWTVAALPETLQPELVRSGLPEEVCRGQAQVLAGTGEIVTRQGSCLGVASSRPLAKDPRSSGRGDVHSFDGQTIVVGDKVIVIENHGTTCRITSLVRAKCL